MISHFQTITTKYLGPTNTMGSRIKVTTSSGIKKTYSWNYGMSSAENHENAAMKLQRHMTWSHNLIGGETPDGKGYCFIQLDEEEGQA